MSIDSFCCESFDALWYLGNAFRQLSMDHQFGTSRKKDVALCHRWECSAVWLGSVTFLPVACIADLAMIRPAVNLTVLEDAGGQRVGRGADAPD